MKSFNEFEDLLLYIANTMYPNFEVKIGYTMTPEKMLERFSVSSDVLLCSLESSFVDSKFENNEPHQRIYDIKFYALITDNEFMNLAFNANLNFLELELNIDYNDYSVTLVNGNQIYWDYLGNSICMHEIQVII